MNLISLKIDPDSEYRLDLKLPDNQECIKHHFIVICDCKIYTADIMLKQIQIYA